VAELVAVRRLGTRIRVEYLDVRAVISALPHARVGFVVPKYGHSSVERNRLKRRLRELVRTRLLPALRVGPQRGPQGGPPVELEDHGGGDRAVIASNVGPSVVANVVPMEPPAGHTPEQPTVAGAPPPSRVPPVDVVVRALPTAYEAPFAALAAQVDRVYAGVRQRVMRSDG
jgi:RNase P protein component